MINDDENNNSYNYNNYKRIVFIITYEVNLRIRSIKTDSKLLWSLLEMDG